MVHVGKVVNFKDVTKTAGGLPSIRYKGINHIKHCYGRNDRIIGVFQH